MKAVQLHAFEGPGGYRVADLPEPRPGPGEAVVRIRATSLNYRDLLVARGDYSRKIPLPLVPLSDGAGEVIEVGPGVSRVRVGDRVASAFMPAWIDGPPTDAGANSALGAAAPGVLTEFIALPADGLVSIPEHLTFEEAATLPCAAVTAWHALVIEGNVRAGETVLIQGTGGVSLFALQFARLAGARVIATSSSEEKLERAIRMGASDGINYQATPDWEARVLELTDGLGVDHVVEVGGAGTLPRSIKAVRRGGRISLIGVLTGGEIDPRPLLMKNVRAQGIFVGSRAMFEGMNRAIALHKLRPVVDQVFPIDRTAEALRHLESGSHFGKVVIRV